MVFPLLKHPTLLMYMDPKILQVQCSSSIFRYTHFELIQSLCNSLWRSKPAQSCLMSYTSLRFRKCLSHNNNHMHGTIPHQKTTRCRLPGYPSETFPPGRLLSLQVGYLGCNPTINHLPAPAHLDQQLSSMGIML